MLSKYNPKDFEKRIYKRWLEEDAFKVSADSLKPAFTISMPPPNITGRLHIGHALNHTEQDILIRYKRMAGFESFWAPGTDHASIATEVLVVRMLREKFGISKLDLGRQEFLKHAWEWRESYGRQIIEQMKLIGDSADWSKERFTMDEGCSDAVKASFIELYEKGYIYRGERLITWCPSCKTTISDAEIDHEERDGNMYTINYPFVDGGGGLKVATSRPETMFGDVAVAVHPEDSRYTDYIGKMVINPVNGKHIPIITAEEIEIEFGTGALKITPAHAEVDYHIGIRNDLPVIDSINDDGTMNHYAGKYKDMDRYECKKMVIEELKENGYLLGEKTHNHVVGRCDRCKTDVEPKISDQWFVKMKELAEPAIKAYKDGSLKFHPDNYAKLYINWLEKIRDWNISRQLWWGHQIPAYYCDDCSHTMVKAQMPEKCCKCGGTNITQDKDVLDTWFSSALWPFSTLGWPEKTDLYNKFYPTDVLLTSYDIIPLWVVRMVFQGIEQTGTLPFKHVVINGLVRDKHGKKMSKSAGNGIDPLELVDDYGADALRFGLILGNSSGADIRMHTEKVEYARNFANKLWNASRFVLNGMDLSVEFIEKGDLDLSDRWILARTAQVIEEVTSLLDKYDIQFASSKLHDFIWSEYCDWFIELSKRPLYSDNQKLKRDKQFVLVTVLKTILKLMHPYMPFITEEIWGSFASGMITVADWPIADDIDALLANKKENRISDIFKMNLIMEAIRGIRNVRAEMNIPNSRKSECIVIASDGAEIFLENKEYIIALANCTDVVYAEKRIDNATLVHAGKFEIYLPLDDLIDYEVEAKRLEKEIKTLEKEVERIEKKLSNEGFVSKAPKNIVMEEGRKLEEYKTSLSSARVSFKALLDRNK